MVFIDQAPMTHLSVYFVCLTSNNNNINNIKKLGVLIYLYLNKTQQYQKRIEVLFLFYLSIKIIKMN